MFFVAAVAAALWFIPGGSPLAQVSYDERQRLEQELSRLENQIDQYENTIGVYQKQGKTLKGEIVKLNTQISKINLQVKAITLEIAKLDLEIARNKTQAEATEKNLNFNRRALASALQNISEADGVSVVQILLQNDTLSGFSNMVHGLVKVQDSLRLVVQRIRQLREQLLDQRQDLALRKSDKRTLMASRDLQRLSLEDIKKEKGNLLTKTKGEEQVYQQLLKVTRQTAAQIRNKIFQFLGGGELTFGDAYQLAKAAQDAVGVRASLILAVLDRESALGQNVGRCKYREAMHPRRDTPLFLALAAELNINPDSVSVSCANRDGAYGGAMGPAQFIPSTWNIYKNRVADLTGNRPASPWRNVDAFMATALYLKDAGADSEKNASQDRAAAARYYAGNRWRRYLWTYGERVVLKARQFDEDIAALLS